MKLAEVKIKGAKPTSQKYKLSDGGGLYLEVTPAGGKLWRYKYRFNGKEKLLSLGKYPDVSLKKAREKHQKARQHLIPASFHAIGYPSYWKNGLFTCRCEAVAEHRSG